ncbi:MAG: hypothetical protein LBC61_04280 [Candidatus Peribacteria bacterium]|nr:hypothetical protein [Candidatus Peribacteria bacterium]
MKPEYLERIFETLHRNFEFASDIEITIEANPENITKENLVVWREF